jgi:anti-sigma factor RsiW
VNCQQAREHASDYIDGELGDEFAALLEAHLAHCASCPPLMAALIGVLAELRGLPAVEPSTTWVQATVARASTVGRNTL